MQGPEAAIKPVTQPVPEEVIKPEKGVNQALALKQEHFVWLGLYRRRFGTD